MTIYKDLDWDRLSDLLEKFNLSYNYSKSSKINGIEIFSDRIDVYPNNISFYREMEYYSSRYEDYDFYTQDVAKIEYNDMQKFDLIVDWEWFEIKLK